MKPEISAKTGQWASSPVASTRRASIRVVRRIDAPPERVFDAWLDPTIAGNWLFATASRPMARADIDARVAGRFGFAARDDEPIEYRGEYLEIVRERRIAFTLVTKELPQVATRVVVEITALGKDGGSVVALTHENVPPGFATRTRQRWTGILYGLDVTLASRTEEKPCNTC